MITLLEKKELRDLTILTLLYSEERWWNADELAQKADCSVDSANKSISTLMAISATLDQAFELTTQKNRGVLLQASSNYSITYLRSLYYRETTTYKIIDLIFQGQNLSIEWLMDKLYLSKSTLYRKLKTIELVLANNQLTLDKNNLTIDGSEIALREFFYVFYWSIIRNEMWPFHAVPKDILEHRLKTILRTTHLELSPIEEIQMYYRMAINFIQHKKKRFVTELPQDIKLDPYRLEFLTEIATVLTETIPVAHQKKEFDYVALIFATYPYMSEAPLPEDLQKTVAWHKEKQTPAYQLTIELLSQLTSVYSNPLLAKELAKPCVLFMLLAISNYALLFPHLSVYEEFKSSWTRQLELYEKETPTFYQELKRIMAEIVESDTFKGRLITPYYSLFSIYSIFQLSFDLSLFEKVISVKLICAFDPISEASQAALLEKQVNHNLIITTSKFRNDHRQQYDLLISDVSLTDKDSLSFTHEYIWDFPPSDRDWSNIKELLQQITQEKKQGQNDLTASN